MASIIKVDQIETDVNLTGSASAPSLYPKNDTNTGVFFPAVDTVATSTGGSERMRIDSSGNVGIGTSSPSARLDVRTTSSTQATFTRTGQSAVCTIFQSTADTYVSATNAGAALILATQDTERMRIDSSGRVTKPYQPAFKVARLSSGNQGTTEHQIPFDYAILNIGNHFNTSTYRFTAPVAGTYFLSVGLMNNQANTGIPLVKLRVNGVQKSYWHLPSAHPASGSWSSAQYMNAGDTADVTASNYHWGDSTSGFDYPYFSGFLIG